MAMALMAVVFTGCSATGGGDDFEGVPMGTYYLLDADAQPVSGVQFDCGEYWGTTGDDGEYQYETQNNVCEFKFYGINEPLYIYDANGPVNGMNYECSPSEISGTTGISGEDGQIDYLMGDSCTLWPQ